MMKARSSSFPIRLDPASRGGFTLVELLVSMTVLILIVVMLTQVVRSTGVSIQQSTRGMDSNQLATLALDRIGNNLAGMIASGGGTLVAVKGANGSDGLAMLTNGRVRSRATGSKVSVSDFTDIRLGALGYCVINTPDPDLAGFPAVPMLNGGDGTVSWSAQDTTDVQGDPLKALSQAAGDVSAQMNTSPAAGAMLQFSPLSRGIFRFEVAFLLSDGSLVSGKTPPLNKHFVTGGVGPLAPLTFASPLLPLAFGTADSDDTANAGPGGQPLYVRAVVVGIASLDPATLQILSANQRAQLGGVMVLAKAADGQTPLQAWDISNGTLPTYQSLQAHFPPPVLQNIRFSQRYFYVH